jgi:hypothetical protein
MMTSTTTSTPTEATVRLASRQDSAGLADLFARVVLDSDLSFAVERDPDFFALYDMEWPAREQVVFTAQLDGKDEGVASFLGRDAYLRGQRVRTAYMSDLRVSPKISGKVFGKMMGERYQEARRVLGAELMYTAVFDSNKAAQKALVERNPRFPDKPWYNPLRKFSIQSLHFLSPRALRLARHKVRKATARDLDAIVAMLTKDHEKRPFGYVFEDGLLERRLKSWPRFGIERFYLAVDARDNILGCVAPWDALDVKRYRVVGYKGDMRWVKRGYNLAARALGAQPLPEPGGLLRYLYLTHVCVPSEDPGVMAALVDAVYAEHWGRGYCFICSIVEQGDPLSAAYRGYVSTGLPATLYAVTPHDQPLDASTLGQGRAGFEACLA